uniref:Uncharacterized protein n=1 Tax=Lactuca sativa TaxID=4236 RepID=A0A9R1X7Y9_LACSA|nr:hypothetical protein LSAT_V11C600308110 [Lactuca sativa]
MAARVGRHPRMAARVGRHPRMVVPGRSGTPEMPDKYEFRLDNSISRDLQGFGTCFGCQDDTMASGGLTPAITPGITSEYAGCNFRVRWAYSLYKQYVGRTSIWIYRRYTSYFFLMKQMASTSGTKKHKEPKLPEKTYLPDSYSDDDVFDFSFLDFSEENFKAPSKLYDDHFLNLQFDENILRRDIYGMVDDGDIPGVQQNEHAHLDEDDEDVGVEYMVHDPNLDWKEMRPRLGDCYESPAQLRNYHFGSLVTSNWLAKRYLKDVIMKPNMTLLEMQAYVLQRLLEMDGTEDVEGKKYTGLELKNLFWEAAMSIVEGDFLATMEKIKKVTETGYTYLMARKPETWCRAFFSHGYACEAVENEVA